MSDYYAIIPAKVRYDKNLPPNAKLIYGELVVLCQKEGFCWASNKYFAELYNVDKHTVSVWLGALAKRGYISFEGIDKNVKGIDKKINDHRQIYLHPLDKNINQNIYKINNKNNNSKSKPKKDTFCSYDRNLVEQLLNRD